MHSRYRVGMVDFAARRGEKIHIVRFILVFLCLAYASPICAGSKAKSEVNRHIESLVVRIEEAYQALENAQYRNSIAVFDLADDSPQAAARNLGMACSQFLTTRLTQTGKFYVVERVTLQKVIDEMKLGMTGLVDEATAAKAGKIVGADIIVVGSVSEVGEYFNVNIRLVEVETAHLLVSAVEEIPRDLLIESAGTFKPPSYRVGITVHTYNDEGDVYMVQEWLGVFFSKDFLERFAAEVELGYAFGTNLEDEETVYSNSSEYAYTYQGLVVEEGPFISSKLHFAFVNLKPLRVTAHAGLSVFRLDYGYSASTEKGDGINYDDKMALVCSPIGISICLQPRSIFSFRIDFDYLVPLNELAVQYPGEPRESLRELSTDLSGPTASASLVMYF